MKLDRLALIIICIVVALWAIMLLTGMLLAPWGWLMLFVVAVPAYFIYRVVRDRLGNAEDDYYEKNVER